MTHILSTATDGAGRRVWVCHHCEDVWRHTPTDICTALLDKLEAEYVAGWSTVPAPQCDPVWLLKAIAEGRAA